MSSDAGKTDHGEQITITVHNEDNGASLSLPAGPGTPVRTLVERMYSDWRLQRKPGDRLRCDVTSANVFQHENDRLGDFVATNCSSRSWLFVGDTGGA